MSRKEKERPTRAYEKKMGDVGGKKRTLRKEEEGRPTNYFKARRAIKQREKTRR